MVLVQIGCNLCLWFGWCGGKCACFKWVVRCEFSASRYLGGFCYIHLTKGT